GSVWPAILSGTAQGSIARMQTASIVWLQGVLTLFPRNVGAPAVAVDKHKGQLGFLLQESCRYCGFVHKAKSLLCSTVCTPPHEFCDLDGCVDNNRSQLTRSLPNTAISRAVTKTNSFFASRSA